MLASEEQPIYQTDTLQGDVPAIQALSRRRKSGIALVSQFCNGMLCMTHAQ
jgi:hypothetical protein